MKNTLLKTVFALAAITILFYSCSKDDTTTPGNNGAGNGSGNGNNNSQAERNAAIQEYNDNFLGSNITDAGWTGNTATCTAGTVSQACSDAVIKRINYFRRMVGLNGDCILDESLSAQEQEAALMMTANNALSHNPPTSWSCYTAAGAAGAGSSNLAGGFNPTESIWQFIKDEGTGNFPVGHRRYVLHSTKQQFAFGSTPNATALYVYHQDANTHIPDFIAYPPKGFIPQQLIPSRWSFAIPGANFTACTVTMTGPGGNVPLTVVSNNITFYGDNSVVWVPTPIDVVNTSDVEYTVTISGITNSPLASYTYKTTIFKP